MGIKMFVLSLPTSNWQKSSRTWFSNHRQWRSNGMKRGGRETNDAGEPENTSWKRISQTMAIVGRLQCNDDGFLVLAVVIMMANRYTRVALIFDREWFIEISQLGTPIIMIYRHWRECFNTNQGTANHASAAKNNNNADSNANFWYTLTITICNRTDLHLAHNPLRGLLCGQLNPVRASSSKVRSGWFQWTELYEDCDIQPPEAVAESVCSSAGGYHEHVLRTGRAGRVESDVWLEWWWQSCRYEEGVGGYWLPWRRTDFTWERRPSQVVGSSFWRMIIRACYSSPSGFEGKGLYLIVFPIFFCYYDH